MIHFLDNQNNAINGMLKKPVGIICMPTGTGKTVVIYGHIKSFMQDDEQKHNFIISGPIQDLNNQTASNILTYLYDDKVITPENCDIVVANCKNKRCNTYYVVKNTENKLVLSKEINGNEFVPFNVNTPDIKQEKKYRITVVCNPTLHDDKKFLDKIDDENVVKHFYFDECQTLKNEPVNKNDIDSVEKDYVNYEKIFKMIRENEGTCHFVSATPTNDNFETIIQNKFAVTYDECFAFRLTPVDAINSRMIVSPRFTIIKNNNITANTLLNTIEVMVSDIKEIKKTNTEYIARALITVNSTEDLDYIETELMKRYGNEFDVFSTCCENGKRKNKISMSPDILEFKRQIESNTRSCFIVHIRQIIAGIDIPSFTHAVFNMDSNTNFIAPIQITGRVLRPESRWTDGTANINDKKFGFVYVNIMDNDNQAERAARTLTDYYGEIFEYLKPDFFQGYNSGSKVRNKRMSQFDAEVESRPFDEYISKFLKKTAKNIYEAGQYGINYDVRMTIEDTIRGRGYVENLPIFYVPELQKYVDKVKDYIDAFAA